MDTDGTVSEVKVAHTGDPEVGCKQISKTLLAKKFNFGHKIKPSNIFKRLKF